jgi:WD repeat-containing protein 19
LTVQISALVGKKTLMLIDLLEPHNPINLQFQTRYGSIVGYEWFGDGYIAVAFDGGFVITISTHVSEIGSEIFSVQDHTSYLSSLAVNKSVDKLATAGDHSYVPAENVILTPPAQGKSPRTVATVANRIDRRDGRP